MDTLPESSGASDAPRPSQVRTLVVMRHGEASGHAASDVERELTARGIEDALSVGRWLDEQGIVLDHALVSGAVRTRSTWTSVAVGAGLAWAPDVRLDLYTASPEAALDEIRLVPEEATCALVLGHNPTVSFLATLLQDGQGDSETLTSLIQGFPPASVVVLQFSGAWSELGFGDARVTHFRTPGH